MSDTTIEKTVQNALRFVAKQEGISVENVRRGIEIAIAAARQNDDPAVRAFWESIPAKGSDSLTAEDVIAYFAQTNLEI